MINEDGSVEVAISARIRKDRISSKVIMERLGIKPVKDVIRIRRLGWFGHVERREEAVDKEGGKYESGRKEAAWKAKENMGANS